MLSKCTKPKSLYVPNLYTGYSHISVSLSLIMLFPMHGLINTVFQISHLFTELHCLPQLHFVLFNNTITFKKQHLTKKITWRVTHIDLSSYYTEATTELVTMEDPNQLKGVLFWGVQSRTRDQKTENNPHWPLLSSI